MATRQIRIGEDCIQILEKWIESPFARKASYSEAIRRMDQYIKDLSDVRAALMKARKEKGEGMK